MKGCKTPSERSWLVLKNAQKGVSVFVGAEFHMRHFAMIRLAWASSSADAQKPPAKVCLLKSPKRGGREKIPKSMRMPIALVGCPKPAC